MQCPDGSTPVPTLTSCAIPFRRECFPFQSSQSDAVHGWTIMISGSSQNARSFSDQFYGVVDNLAISTKDEKPPLNYESMKDEEKEPYNKAMLIGVGCFILALASGGVCMSRKSFMYSTIVQSSHSTTDDFGDEEQHY